MNDLQQNPASDDEQVTHWERWPWEWISAVVGVAGALGDVGVLLFFGVKMDIAGHDATPHVLALLTVTYGWLGFTIGQLLQGRARATRDHATIARQLGELERAQRDLVQQEKLAAIGRVAAGVAHEVRNPLGVIRASASMVQESFGENEDPYRACEFICEEADRLNSLITALLTFSRPTELKRQQITLSKVVDRALTLTTDELRKRSIELDREDEEGVPQLSADPDLVSQVVYGLVLNASEALGEGGRITVRTSRHGSAVRVEVADSGDGIEPDVAAHVFEPFFTTKATGTGLGLPMAERIVGAHGGSLSIVMGDGAGPGHRGACFRLELPVEASAPRPDAAAAAVQALESARQEARA